MKKIVMIVLTVALCAAMLVSCAAPAAAPSASASAAASESAAPSADASASAGAAAAGDYMAWTKAEWDAATDADKDAATVAVLAKSGEILLGVDVTDMIEAAKTDEKVKAELDIGVASMKKSINTFFEQMPTANIGQLVDAMEQLVKQSESQN